MGALKMKKAFFIEEYIAEKKRMWGKRYKNPKNMIAKKRKKRKKKREKKKL